MSRTIAIGDIHGDLAALDLLLSRLPALNAADTLVFLGDYLDTGPDSRGVVARLRSLPTQTPAKVVTLRGNHEDAWLQILDGASPGFVVPPGNGCQACLRSFLGLEPGAELTPEQMLMLLEASFFPADVVAWMRALPAWYEDEHAIYVHAGLPREDGRWLHPREVEHDTVLLWTRSKAFFLEYDDKTVLVGHTGTSSLPEGISLYTPEDDADLYWAGRSAYCLDTGCGKGGFLTAFELPERLVYESRGR